MSASLLFRGEKKGEAHRFGRGDIGSNCTSSGDGDGRGSDSDLHLGGGRGKKDLSVDVLGQESRESLTSKRVWV